MFKLIPLFNECVSVVINILVNDSLRSHEKVSPGHVPRSGITGIKGIYIFNLTFY